MAGYADPLGEEGVSVVQLVVDVDRDALDFGAGAGGGAEGEDDLDALGRPQQVSRGAAVGRVRVPTERK